MYTVHMDFKKEIVTLYVILNPHAMELTLQILLGMVALICFLGGMNLLLKGAHSFLPAGTPTQITLDNLFRFLSGIYFSMGFLMTWIVMNIHEVQEMVYFLGLVVTCSGLGRLYSKMKVGSGGAYLNNIMIFEIVLGTVIIILQYLRSN